MMASKLREVAVAASCDPRTVQKVLDGKPVRGMAEQRVRDALKKLGLPAPPASKRGGR